MSQPRKTVDPGLIIDLGYPIKMISLGNLCNSRTFAERFHLFDFKTYGVRMPFDGCNTPYRSVCHLIKNDFCDFCDNLVQVSRKNPLDGNIITDYKNTALNIHYNHEYSDDLDNIKKQFELRKNQFIRTLKESANDGSVIVFFLECNVFPNELIKNICEKYPDLKFFVFTLDTNDYLDGAKESRTDHGIYINIPKPHKKYMPTTHRESPEGRIHERKVLDAFMESISNITGIEYDTDSIFKNRSATPYRA